MYESPGESPAAVEPSPAPSAVESAPPSFAPDAPPTEDAAPADGSAPAAPATPSASQSTPAAPAAPALPADTSASEWAEARQYLSYQQGTAAQQYQQLVPVEAMLRQAQQTLPPDQYLALEASYGYSHQAIVARMNQLAGTHADSASKLERLGLAEQQWQMRQTFEPLARAEMERREETRAIERAQVPPDQRAAFTKGLQRFLKLPYHDARDMPANVDAFADMWREQQASTRAAAGTDFMGGTGSNAPSDLSKYDADELFRMEAAQVRQRRRA